MSSNAFSRTDTWIFDLDNTLYPADCHLFRQIDERMTSFIQRELDCDFDQARFLQKDWYAKHGTTLSGLIIEHDITPHHFLDYVHDIDLTPVEENSHLRDVLQALPGQRLIFTNGSVRHAENVAGRIGILDLFDGVFDIEAGGFTPKPHAAAYDIFMSRFGITPDKCAFFEDMPQNLQVPFETGMQTVLVQSSAAWFDDEPDDKRPARPGEKFDHVHHVTDDLTRFLGEVRTQLTTTEKEEQ